MPSHVKSSRRRSPRPQARLVWLLALALVAVQSLGFLHRIVHADSQRARSSLVEPAAVESPTSGARSTAGHEWLAMLFSAHQGAHDCDGFDQMSHLDATVGGALDTTTEPPAEAPAVVHPAWHIAAQAQGFLARAPPIVT